MNNINISVTYSILTWVFEHKNDNEKVSKLYRWTFDLESRMIWLLVEIVQSMVRVILLAASFSNARKIPIEIKIMQEEIPVSKRSLVCIKYEPPESAKDWKYDSILATSGIRELEFSWL